MSNPIVRRQEKGGAERERRRKKKEGRDNDVVGDVDPKKKKQRQGGAPPRNNKRKEQPPHWASSLAASAGPPVLLGIAAAVATVQVARLVTSARQQKLGELNKRGTSFDGSSSSGGSSFRKGGSRPDAPWRDDVVGDKKKPSSSPSLPLRPLPLPPVERNEQTLVDVTLRGVGVRELWRLVACDGSLHRSFMASRGNEDVQGGGWRVKEVEEEEGEGGEGGEGEGGGGAKKTRVVEVRTRVLTYLTPIGRKGRGNNTEDDSSSSDDDESNKRDHSLAAAAQHLYRSGSLSLSVVVGGGSSSKSENVAGAPTDNRTTPCRETWTCRRRSDSGFVAKAVVETPQVPMGQRFHTELTWAATRVEVEEEGGVPASTTKTPTMTRLRITGRVVFDRPCVGLKRIITSAVDEGLRDSYADYRRLLLREVAKNGGKGSRNKEERGGWGKEKPERASFFFVFVFLLLFASFAAFAFAFGVPSSSDAERFLKTIKGALSASILAEKARPLLPLLPRLERALWTKK